MLTLTLNRKGTFRIAARPGVPQCAKPGHEDMAYVLRLTCAAALDRNGYLVPHEALDLAIRSGASSAGTCERVTVSALRAVLALCHDQKVPVVRCRLDVFPRIKGARPKAYMTADWTPEVSQ